MDGAISSNEYLLALIDLKSILYVLSELLIDLLNGDKKQKVEVQAKNPIQHGLIWRGVKFVNLFKWHTLH